MLFKTRIHFLKNAVSSLSLLAICSANSGEAKPLVWVSERKAVVEEMPAALCGDYPKFPLPNEAGRVYQQVLEIVKNRQVTTPTGSIEPAFLELSGSALEKGAFPLILGQKPPARWRETIEGCTTVLCALSRLFGSEEAAQRVLVVYFYSGYVISLDQSEHQHSPERIFSLEDIREIDAALRLLPKNLYRMPTFRDIVTADPKPDAVASARAPTSDTPGRILIRDNADYVVFLHEFGHQVDYAHINASRSAQREFLDIAWADGKQEFILKNSNAQISPAEAFAELFKYYVLWPQILGASNRAGYDYLKKQIFAGKEYPETRLNCPPLNRFPSLSFQH